MGNNQTTSSWSTDDWAYGTGANAVPVEEVVEEVGKLPARFFGGKAIENDASMHKMQHDLLSFDETLKRLFRRRKSKKASNQVQQEEEEYYEDGQAAPEGQDGETEENSTYLSPTTVDRDASAAVDAAPNRTKLLWHCSNCAADNKVTESSCRRCGQAETKL